jgi:hypothetical protein
LTVRIRRAIDERVFPGRIAGVVRRNECADMFFAGLE